MKKEEAVANFFIALGNSDSEDYMTNLRLNKLMYFAQAWSLVLFDNPLFSEDIHAWQLGPVVPSIYHKYKHKGKNQIINTDTTFKLNMLSFKEQQLLMAILGRYGKYSTSGLVDITHYPGSPWDKAYTANADIISTDQIKAYFKNDVPLKLACDCDEYPIVGYHNSKGAYVLPTDWK